MTHYRREPTCGSDFGMHCQPGPEPVPRIEAGQLCSNRSASGCPSPLLLRPAQRYPTAELPGPSIESLPEGPLYVTIAVEMKDRLAEAVSYTHLTLPTILRV